MVSSKNKAIEGGLKLDFKKRLAPKASAKTGSISRGKGLAKIDQKLANTEVTTGLANNGSYYTVDLTFGSQKEVIAVDIDTGSSDLFVISSAATCPIKKPGEEAGYCLKFGTFDVSLSTTIKNQNQKFSITYGDTTGASGEYYLDLVGISGTTISPIVFAVADVASATPGVFGIGFDAIEAVTTGESDYLNFPAQLVQQGYITKNFYSLYLDSPTAKGGTVIFGGIDNTKYTGSLVTVPLTSNSEFFVTLDTITATGLKYSVNAPVLLDSGTTITLLAKAAVDAIAKLYPNAKYDNLVGLYHVSGSPTGSLTYNIGSASISIPFSSLVEPASDYGGSSGYYLDIAYAGNDPNILGDNFLRWAYVVYDLTDFQVSIAQSKFT